jgi:GNAT superfamily N-acetyltransferase
MWAAQRNLPWMLSVCHETMGELMDQAVAILDEEGMAPIMPLTGMETSDVLPDPRPRPEGVWLNEAADGIGGKVMRVNEAAYQMPLGEPGSLESEHPGWWGAPGRMVTMLQVDGQPASCAAVLSVDGLRYVALVATAPEAQKRGYAAVAMRDVLARSLAAGLKQRTYLHATAAGKPVYERMGYVSTANYTVFLRKEFFPPEH